MKVVVDSRRVRFIAEGPKDVAKIKRLRRILTKGTSVKQERHGILYPTLPHASDSDNSLSLSIKKVSKVT